MKIFCRIFLVFLGCLTITAVAACFIVTRPAFQKILIEYILPEGSSIEAAQITNESIELTDLNATLPNGMIVQIDSLYSKFSIFSVLFEETILLSGIKLEGLKIKLLESKASLQPSLNSAVVFTSDNLSTFYRVLFGALHYVEEIDWLFDIDPVEVSGELIDTFSNSHSFVINATPFAPGLESIVRTNINLKSENTYQTVLKDFDSAFKLIFNQKEYGGFEQFRLESLVESAGISEDVLLSIRQDLDLSFTSSEKVLKMDYSFDADIKRPEFFVPELAGIEGLSLKGCLETSFDGNKLILNEADIDAEIQDVSIATLKLMQSLNLGNKQAFFGEIMKFDLINFPLNLINPFLGNEIKLSGEPINAEIIVVGDRSEKIQVISNRAIKVGPFSIKKNAKTFLDKVIFQTSPVLSLNAKGYLYFDLGEFQLLDRYGDIIQGRVSGSKEFVAADSLLAGMKADAQFNLDLSGLLRQPILKGRTSIMGGQAELTFKINSEENYPAQMQGYIAGLRVPNSSSIGKEHSFFGQFKKTETNDYTIESKFSIGPNDNPSSNFLISTQLVPGLKHYPFNYLFKLSLNAAKLSQADLEFMYSALKPLQGFQNNHSIGQNSKSSSLGTSRPYWANFDGEAAIMVDEFIMTSGYTIIDVSALATVSEPVSQIKQLDFLINNNILSGKAKVVCDFQETSDFQISSTLTFNDIDPSIFSKKHSGSFPLDGYFDGTFNLNGQGLDFKALLDNAHYDFIITGQDGFLTALDLDERSQLGLLGASILGQSFNRPGITAMSLAIPYFKDVHFDSFMLKLTKSPHKTINISKLLIQGDDLRIYGLGSIDSSNLNDLMEKPLLLTLDFGARGRLIDYLETLGLLAPTIDSDGFRTLKNSINIGGTVSKPDASALKIVLTQAAIRAFAQPSVLESPQKSNERPLLFKQESTGPNKDKKKSKEENIIEDIENGLNLLDSILR